MALHLKPQFILRRNPNFITHLFSTSSSSSSSNDDQSNSNNDEQSTNQSPLRPYFSDVKASLKQTPNQSDPSFSFSRSSSQSPQLNEIRRNLAQFRLKSAPEPSPSPTTSTTGRAVSFQELYRKNMAQKTEDANNALAKAVSFDSIRESLTRLRSNHQNQVPNQGKLFNNKEFRYSLNTGGNSTVVRGGSETTLTPPLSFITQEEKKEEGDSSVKNDLVKPYTYVELGEKLRKLRPTDSKVIGKNWLSFKELNERLVKLREYEFKDMDATRVLGSGSPFKDLRESLVKLKDNRADVGKRKSPQMKIEILSTLGGTETYLLGDPKEHLVEKYFHPDNMSSAEKLKLELKKIRDEFKLSESDCGSSRVQVAQLTVKIKHLSSVLHKKDKHSRKGLQEMVQRRKKLLRYLRRTDWDSYCFCLNKLGLRDNPDYKN